MKPELILVAAIDDNRLLATEHGIPWKLPDDVAHFRACCAGKWLLLGHRTFDEMRGWFQPDQVPLVLTTACGYDPTPGRGVASVLQAMALAEAACQSELVCIGGGQVFAAAMPEATRLVITHVAHAFDPGLRPVHFPTIDPLLWSEVSRKSHGVDEAHRWAFDIVEYERQPR